MDQRDDLAVGKYLRESFETMAQTASDDLGLNDSQDLEIDTRLQNELEKS
jgi:hypothetical protein